MKVRIDRLDDAAEVGAVGRFGHVTDMRRGQHVRHRPERVVYRQRLLLEYVQAGTRDLAAAQGFDQRLAVNDWCPQGVDEVGGRTHESKLPRADQPSRAVTEHDMDGDEVAALQQLVLRRCELHSRGGGFVGGQVLAPGHNLHAERLPDARDVASDMAEAEQP
ncbi:hypothetical protein BGX30_001857 [Mortierella sp. GBA39]|nr:hypothetical protein BGX30_001857 [Mortierella sp. GBA39]